MIPEIQERYNRTLVTIAPDFGNDVNIMRTLDLGYRVKYLGIAEGEAKIKQILSSADAILFMIWTPHQWMVEFNLTRITLPRYTTKEAFIRGHTDYAPDPLLKLAAKNLPVEVLKLYKRFSYGTDDQEKMLAEMDMEGKTVVQVTCHWLKEHLASWKRWFLDDLMCDPGEFLVKNGTQQTCEACPEGSSSPGGARTSCKSCAAGPLHTLAPERVCTWWPWDGLLMFADSHGSAFLTKLICRIFSARKEFLRVHHVR
jgi:hypothetical protein